MYFYHSIDGIMKEKQIELLRKQIDKLSSKDFDLEAWKNYTVILLARLFGENNQKIKQIEKLDYEYNSWSLRDTSGYSDYLQSCKKLGREILEASIDEIESFGVPENAVEVPDTVSVDVILNALADELKGSEYRNLIRTLLSEALPEEKKRQIHDIVKVMGCETVEAILESILLNGDFVAGLKE